LLFGSKALYVIETTTRGNYTNKKVLTCWWSTEYTEKYVIE
jgi:hypothetical protein